MNLPMRPWSQVNAELPESGRHLLACFDDDTITVFAAHHPNIGAYAAEHGRFGGDMWRHDRTTRFRLSLPRVMARSRQGVRPGKQAVLAISLARDRVDSMLRQAVHWREFPEGLYDSKGAWRLATRYSQVVMDWAPDCGPDGSDLRRFTPRFGVRAHLLKSFSRDWILGIRDLSDIAADWREADDPPTPLVRPYPLSEPALAARLFWSPESA